jgi:hypothetical protein
MLMLFWMLVSLLNSLRVASSRTACVELELVGCYNVRFNYLICGVLVDLRHCDADLLRYETERLRYLQRLGDDHYVAVIEGVFVFLRVRLPSPFIISVFRRFDAVCLPSPSLNVLISYY